VPVKKGIKTGIEALMYGVIREGIQTWDSKKNEENMKRDGKKDGKRVLLNSNSSTTFGNSKFFELSGKKLFLEPKVRLLLDSNSKTIF
jgi:hypothetical protein